MTNAMINLSQAYETRPLRFLDHWHIGDWRLKAYTIAYGNRPVQEPLLAAARRVAEERLRLSAAQTAHYHVGFVGVHEGKTGNFVFVDWWADENELHHHVYVSPLAEPAALEYRTPSGLAACIWDLALISHERDAWSSCILKQYPRPDVDAYLAATLTADI